MSMKKFNNEFSNKNLGEEVVLKGWVQKARNLGGLIFIDLRDRTGILQVVVKPENTYYSLASKIRSEFVIEVKGTIIKRSSINSKIENGDIEIDLTYLNILSESNDLPFELINTTALEDTRLKYRYLDIRRENIKNNIVLRHKVTSLIRNYLNELSFIEVETPILTKSTPEGARDYLVPSRVYNGKFYALPQSPQLFKQLLMVGGIERYYQFARCFRDEDLRADRQPEFTQLDMELSFVEQEDVMNVVEGLMKKIFKDFLGVKFDENILKIKYEDAINDFGSDRPDLRFDLKLRNLADVFKHTEFDLFKINGNEAINCLVVENNISRKEQDKLVEFVKKFGLNKLFFLKYENKEFSGSLVKNLSDNELKDLKELLTLKGDSTIIIAKDSHHVVKKSLGALRLKLGKDLSLINEGEFKPLWVVDFPMFEYDDEAKRYFSAHHPFTAPINTDLNYLNEPSKCYAKAYDFVINGYEVGGGSIRISDPKLQEKVFETLGLTKDEIKLKFGFLTEAFKYGVPPHGGIAFGLERIIMLLSKTENIKDVIAFPKTASAQCLMTEAPNTIDDSQLKELGLKKENL